MSGKNLSLESNHTKTNAKTEYCRLGFIDFFFMRNNEKYNISHDHRPQHGFKRYSVLNTKIIWSQYSEDEVGATFYGLHTTINTRKHS